MSCGQIALNRVDIKYDNYFASEIDKFAIKVTQHNYPNTIQLGDITKIDSSMLPQIDLIIGGSPCQGFSFAGKQLNFNDERSMLFFEYVRLLKELKPKYFLLENVKMKQEYQDVISAQLGVRPILINSALVSAQNRNRLYWSNLQIIQPSYKYISLKDILLDDISIIIDVPTQSRIDYIKRRVNKGWMNGDYLTESTIKTSCVLAACYKTMREFILSRNNKLRFLDCVELERLQTIPDNYSSCVSKSQRRKMIGNGWTVDVIAHILKEIV